MPRKTYNPLPGTRDDPNRNEDEHGMVLTRDDGLADVPPHALTQLTALLRMDPEINFAKPDKTWLANQEAQIEKLDASLRLPAKLFQSLALRVNSLHRMPFFPQCAQLCLTHKGLDPRVIRNMTRLVGHECTLRTDRFRAYRKKANLTDFFNGWLDRVDSITAMWIGKHAFRMLYGYKNASPAVQGPEDRCEACIMAVIGGRPQTLCDLRANIIARKARHSDDRSDPRLLRILDEWINQFDAETRNAVLNECDLIVRGIQEAYQQITDYRDRRNAERGSKGKAPKEHHHRRRRRRTRPVDGPSIPTQSSRSSTSGPIETPNNQQYEAPPAPPSRSTTASSNPYNAPPPASSISPSRPTITSNSTYNAPPSASTISPSSPPAGVVNRNRQTAEWEWLCGRMHGLSTKEREAVMQNIHPAVSTFHTSAAPGSLHPEGQGDDIVETVLDYVPNPADLDDDGWVSVSVRSSSGEDTPKVSAFSNDNKPDDDVDENGAYVPVRSNWQPIERSENPFVMPPPAPVSSFYSDHPGFPTNHRVTEVQRPRPGGPAFKNVNWDQSPR